MSELQRNDHINLCLIRSENVSSGKKGIQDYFGKHKDRLHRSHSEPAESFYLVDDPLDSTKVIHHSKSTATVRSVISVSQSRASVSKSNSTTLQVKTAKFKSQTEIVVSNSILVEFSFHSYVAHPISKGLFQRELDFHLFPITYAF